MSESGKFETKLEAVLDAIEEAMGQGGADVVVCAGPPVCMLQAEEADAEMSAGCPLCRRIRIESDGTQTEFKAKVN